MDPKKSQLCPNLFIVTGSRGSKETMNLKCGLKVSLNSVRPILVRWIKVHRTWGRQYEDACTRGWPFLSHRLSPWEKPTKGCSDLRFLNLQKHEKINSLRHLFCGYLAWQSELNNLLQEKHGSLDAKNTDDTWSVCMPW